MKAPRFLTLSLALASFAVGQDVPKIAPFAWRTPLPRTEEGRYTPIVLEPGSDGGWFVGVDFPPLALVRIRVAVTKFSVAGSPLWTWEDRPGSPIDSQTIQDVVASSDGGCVALFTVTVPNNGRLEEPLWNRGNRFVAVKLDVTGEEQWRRTFGGTDFNMAREIHRLPDGGYLIGAMSSAPQSPAHQPLVGEGEARTSPALGQVDVWIIKLSALGVVEWEQSLGGPRFDLLFGSQDAKTFFGSSSGSDLGLRANTDVDHDLLVPTADGGVVLGYTTYALSPSSAVGLDPRASACLAKLDSKGKIEWEKTFDGPDGDSAQLVISALGNEPGFLLAGMTLSGVGGTKTTPKFGKQDVWLIRVNDRSETLWELTLGGDGEEVLQTALATPDGGFLVSLHSNSKSLLDKSGFGLSDAWVIKIAAQGQAQWANAFGGAGVEMTAFGANLAPLADGGYWMVSNSSSPAGGNRVSPNEGLRVGGRSDLWMVRFDAAGRKLGEHALPFGEFQGLKTNAAGDVVLAFADLSPRQGGASQLLKLFSDCPTSTRMWISRRSATNSYFSVEVPCGVAYSLETSPDLSPESWRPLLSLLGTGAPQEFPLILDRKAKSQFFRLNLNPPRESYAFRARCWRLEASVVSPTTLSKLSKTHRQHDCSPDGSLDRTQSLVEPMAFQPKLTP